MLLSRHSVPISYLISPNARFGVTGCHLFKRAKLASRSPGRSSFTADLQQLYYNSKSVFLANPFVSVFQFYILSL